MDPSQGARPCIAMAAFAALGKAVYADGALPEKTRELLVLAIGIATHCEGCIAHHARALHETDFH